MVVVFFHLACCCSFLCIYCLSSSCLLLVFISFIASPLFAFDAFPLCVCYFSFLCAYYFSFLLLLFLLFAFVAFSCCASFYSPFCVCYFPSLHLLLLLIFVLATTPLFTLVASSLHNCYCSFFALDSSSCLDFVIWNARYEMDISVGKYLPILKSSIWIKLFFKLLQDITSEFFSK
jgi:hypothetical protein